jgi:hypothetical protein
MHIKSWYLVLVGILLQVLFGLFVLSGALSYGGLGGFVGAIVGSTVLFISLLGPIPLFLLIFQKTRKIGSIVSIILGLIGIAINFGFIIGIFLIIAGILALWKKM